MRQVFDTSILQVHSKRALEEVATGAGWDDFTMISRTEKNKFVVHMVNQLLPHDNANQKSLGRYKELSLTA